MNIYRVSSLLLAHTLCFRIFEFVHFVLVSLLFNDFFEMRSLRWLLFNWIYWVVLRGYLYLVLSRRLVLCFSGGASHFGLLRSSALWLGFFCFGISVDIVSFAAPKKVLLFIVSGGGATLRLLPSVFLYEVVLLLPGCWQRLCCNCVRREVQLAY